LDLDVGAQGKASTTGQGWEVRLEGPGALDVECLRLGFRQLLMGALPLLRSWLAFEKLGSLTGHFNRTTDARNDRRDLEPLGLAGGERLFQLAFQRTGPLALLLRGTSEDVRRGELDGQTASCRQCPTRPAAMKPPVALGGQAPLESWSLAPRFRLVLADRAEELDLARAPFVQAQRFKVVNGDGHDRSPPA
jgi:hypothetical protein